ncbi:MAG TPA: squalene synthase HpnC [Candidatus Binataceae bacterium]|nr:squalene synthase HpnC [Candidatus Binataceae bacterium]
MEAIPTAGAGEAAAALNAPNPALHSPAQPLSLAQAYDFCGRLARSHYENFTVASWLMPRAMRKHMHAIYAYARIADDFADEEHDLAKLDGWERELELAYAGTPRHPVFVALADTAEKFAIPKEPFADLLVAFRSDVNFKGFDTFDALLGYCRYSANPVGRLVLYLFGYRDAQRQRLSDLVCSGLQLANFWQDVSVDLANGRIYFPRHELAAHDLTELDLSRGVATKRFIDLMRFEVERARAMLREGGAGLARMVDRRLRRDILMFAGGGLAIARAIEDAGFDVLHARPKLRKSDYLKLGWNAIWGRLDGF